MHYEIIENAVPSDTLFIHGNLSSNFWWHSAVEVWKKRGNQNGRAILAEWRGCGKSTGPELEKELTIPNLAQDYIDLVRFLGLTNLNIIAHSTGGPISVQAMHSAPELFRRAALINPVGAKGIPFSADAIATFAQMSQNKELCAHFILRTIKNQNLSESTKEKIVTDAFHVHPLIWQGVPRMLQEINYSNLLGQIKHEVLVLHGEDDPVIPVEDSIELAKGFQRGSFYKVPGRGHSLNIEDPQLLTVLLDPFLFG